ncbi:MAG: hypothetical protein ROM54_06890 [Anaerobiospirillum sp.]|nr:hypothetical protein [Anaerobiospirillum sp.]
MLKPNLLKRGRAEIASGLQRHELGRNSAPQIAALEVKIGSQVALNQVAPQVSALTPAQPYQRGRSVFMPYQSPEEIAAAESMLIYDLKFIVGQCCHGADEAFIRTFSAMVDQLITGMIELCSVAPALMGPHDAGVHGLVHHNLQTAFVACDQIHHILSFIPESTISCAGKLPESPVNVKPPKPKLGSGLTPEEVVAPAPSTKRKAPAAKAPAPQASVPKDASQQDASQQDAAQPATSPPDAPKQAASQQNSPKKATPKKYAPKKAKRSRATARATYKAAAKSAQVTAKAASTARHAAPEAQPSADLAPEILAALAAGPKLIKDESEPAES